jgi:hypothetical protein
VSKVALSTTQHSQRPAQAGAGVGTAEDQAVTPDTKWMSCLQLKIWLDMNKPGTRTSDHRTHAELAALVQGGDAALRPPPPPPPPDLPAPVSSSSSVGAFFSSLVPQAKGQKVAAAAPEARRDGVRVATERAPRRSTFDKLRAGAGAAARRSRAAQAQQRAAALLRAAAAEESRAEQSSSSRAAQAQQRAAALLRAAAAEESRAEQSSNSSDSSRCSSCSTR